MDDNFSSPSRLKNHNGAENERMVLLKILSSHWEALEKHDSDNNCSQKQRWELWDQITKEFNAHPSVSHIRTVLRVKTLYKNMKTKAKKYQIRMEDSRLTGRIVESDAVSEIMLRVIAAQSAGSTRAVIDALKNGLQDYPVALKTTKPNGLWNKLLDDDSISYYNENQQASSLDGITDIKIEAEDTFESNTENAEIDQRELTTPERILDSVSVSVTSPESPIDVHTFGDISVTPIKDKNSAAQSESPAVPIISENVIAAARLLGILKQKASESNTLSSTLKRSSDQVTSELNLNKKHRMSSVESAESTSWQNNTSSEKCNNFDSDSFESRTAALNVNRCDRQSCCCPEYHKEKLSMAQSEHNIKMAVLQQELELRQLEMSIKESEKESLELDKYRKEVEFRAKREEVKGKKSEHVAKMNLIQLELEIAKSRRNEKPNKWQMINGSKEI